MPGLPSDRRDGEERGGTGAERAVRAPYRVGRGLPYSAANKAANLTWDEKTFAEYIRDPKAKIPGTKMVFVGIKNDKEIADLTAFLKQFGKDGKKM